MATARCVTLATAKAHLRITTPPGHVDDPDLQLKLDAAEAAILRYVGKSAYGLSQVINWSSPETTDPDAVACILIRLGEFWRFRGDDPGAATQSPGRTPGEDLTPVEIGLLRRFTDPVIA
jgi:hypothetical protein